MDTTFFVTVLRTKVNNLVFIHCLDVLFKLAQLVSDDIILLRVITVGAVPEGVVVEGVAGQEISVL